MAENSTTKDELELFQTRSAQVAEAMNWSPQDYLTWVASQLNASTCQELLPKLLRMDSAEQEEAETVLIKLLEQNFRRKRSSWVISDTIGRQTNWAKTFADAAGMIPMRYHNRRQQIELDEELKSALMEQARFWSRLLAKLGNHQTVGKLEDINTRFSVRAKQLADAVDQIPGRPMRRCHLNQRLLKRLQPQIAPAEYQKLTKALFSWDKALGKDIERLCNKLGGWFIKLSDGEDKKKRNDNSLLELTSHLCIVHGALTATVEAIGDGAKWKVVKSQYLEKPIFHLHCGDLNLRIGKGYPQSVYKVGLDLPTDRYSVYRESMGMDPRGMMPDIVLCFYEDSAPDKPFFLFGDAKRNSSDDGKTYLSTAVKGTVAASVLAFGHLSDININLKAIPPSPTIEGPVMPFFTLFLQQGATNIAGLRKDENLENEWTENELETVVEYFRNATPEKNAVPPIIAFDLRHMAYLGNDSEDGMDSNYDRAPIMSAWIGHITRSVQNHFAKTDQSTDRQPATN
jgi:hypothetical protein